jgi:hypothetical protein
MEFFARRGLIFSTPRGHEFAESLGRYYHPRTSDQEFDLQTDEPIRAGKRKDDRRIWDGSKSLKKEYENRYASATHDVSRQR